jgi:hypothetical protein
MVGYARVLRDGPVHLAGSHIQITQNICGVPIARLILDHLEVLRNCRIESALAQQLFRLTQC